MKVLTASDFFCGSGGSGQGIEAVPGVTLRYAVNHSKISIATHAANFPDCEHSTADICYLNPETVPDSDIAWFSPECTNHSTSKGIKLNDQGYEGTIWTDREEDPIVERSRMTMYDVVRFAKEKRYKQIYVENVVEVNKWRHIADWKDAMKELEYEVQEIYFNSMFAPAFPWPVPQSRDRVYYFCRRMDTPIVKMEFNPPAYCVECKRDIASVQAWKKPTQKRGKYKKQYNYCCPQCASIVEPYYYCSLNALDLHAPTDAIGARRKKLAENTLRRIALGLERQRDRDVLPFLFDLAHTKGKPRARTVLEPGLTQTTAQTFALVIPPAFRVSSGVVEKAWEFLHRRYQPFAVSYYSNGRPFAMTEPLGTMTSKERYALVMPSECPDIDACGYRMVNGRETAAFMGFDPAYRYAGAKGIDRASDEEIVRQCGLAVTPAVARMLVEKGTEVLSA